MNKISLYITIILSLCVSQVFAQKVLTLEESKQLALQNNAKSKDSKLEIEAARQVKESAFTNYFPAISGGGTAFYAQKSLLEMESEGGIFLFMMVIQLILQVRPNSPISQVQRLDL